MEDKVLVLLPTDQSKLLMQWKGPFKIKGTKWGNNHQVEVNKKVKTYHISMLKLYVERGRIEETATPGRRDIPGKPRGKPRWAADASRGVIIRRLQLGKWGQIW